MQEVELKISARLYPLLPHKATLPAARPSSFLHCGSVTKNTCTSAKLVVLSNLEEEQEEEEEDKELEEEEEEERRYW